MPGEILDRANPAPKPSHIPDEVLNLAVKLEYNIDDEAIKGLREFRRAANYIAAGEMTFLLDQDDADAHYPKL